MTNPSNEKQQRQLRNLVVMAMADGAIGEREVNLVADRCAELGLSDDAALELPASESAREELMCDLIRMMAADGKLEEGEKRLFALAAVKMDLESDHLDRLIDSTLNG